MSAPIARAARTSFRAAPRAPLRQQFRRNASGDASAAEQGEKKDVLKEGARKDPELYVCLPEIFSRKLWKGGLNERRTSINNIRSS